MSSSCRTCHGLRPRGSYSDRSVRLTRRAGCVLSYCLPPCTTASAFPSSAISGLSPFSLGLTAYALAALRLKVGLESHPGLGRTCSLPSKGSLPGGDLLTGTGFPPARLHNLAQSLRARARTRNRSRTRSRNRAHTRRLLFCSSVAVCNPCLSSTSTSTEKRSPHPPSALPSGGNPRNGASRVQAM